MADSVSLDEHGLAVLDQVLIGLTPIAALPPASTYLDTEGTPVARRVADDLTSLRPVPWPRPDDVRTDKPIVVAVVDRLPAAAVPRDVVVLVPSGAVRADDHRFRTWASAWRDAAAESVPVPVPPDEGTDRAAALAVAYSTAGLADLDTVAMPPAAGRVVFFTGLSGSGKSTLARELAGRLAADRTVTLLDGDVVRTHLSRGLGFSREDRDLNIRRIGWVAAEVAKHAGVAVCAPIAPYDDTRRWVRDHVERTAGPGTFVLVWVSTPIEVCEQRDVKGLYARARAGELTGFTGVDDPYERPHDADVVVDTSRVGLDDAVDQVLHALSQNRGRSTEQ